MSNEFRVPEHIAIIMDGNGRWAAERGEKRLVGHLNGVKAVREAVEGCVENNVKYLTIYAFSTENWGRPEEEVKGLMSLFCSTIAKELPDLLEQGVRLRFMGNTDKLDNDVKENIVIAEELTKENKRLQLIVALDYSSKTELVDVMRAVASDIECGKIKSCDIDENTISNRLYISDIPNPDVMIRTSGEKRISNFMLWQLAYSEFIFLDKLWPDFTREDIKEALSEFAKRDRRYGLITN